ncbi:MAG TPA: DUF1800 domain-containing protein [Casimicrobiaceae bacterium]|jgi:uncharacterized protein (DUF1800 family)|nr:DUF1800 domain-containing protein [Casimicrobiaceae bacterium]
MRIALALAALLLVAHAPSADASALLSYDDARHLLNRTGFGATDAEIRSYVGMTREDAASKLLAGTRSQAVTPAPSWTASPGPLRYPRGGEQATEADRKVFRQEQLREGLELRGWWLEEMITTPSPLTEHMTLFWHNHFVSSQQKVRFAELMYRQNVLLRSNALGNFGVMLHAIARDPAMVIYLDSAQNRKGTPNENFAREVMELFTLGEGHYSEQDIKEAARAFTGWSLDRDSGTFRFRPFIHDYGQKTVLGRTGNLDGDDVLDILLARPETAEFVTRKLWREFVSPDPDEAEVKRIAARFRASGYDIKAALQALLGSDAFYAPQNRGVLVKSPIDLVAGTLRQFDMRPGLPIPFAVASATMGQNLFSPPNVKGWPGGEAWINASTLLARKAFLNRMFRADDAVTPMQAGAKPMPVAAVPKQAIAPNGAMETEAERQVRFMQAMDRGLASVKFDREGWFARLGLPTGAPEDVRDRAQAATRLLLAIPPQTPHEPTDEPLTMVRQLVLDAAYQLK